jgi:hypothetical protein
MTPDTGTAAARCAIEAVWRRLGLRAVGGQRRRGRAGAMEQTGALPGRLRGTVVACTYFMPVPQ